MTSTIDIDHSSTLTGLKAMELDEIERQTVEQDKQMLMDLLAVDPALFLGTISIDMINQFDASDAKMMVTDIKMNALV